MILHTYRLETRDEAGRILWLERRKAVRLVRVGQAWVQLGQSQYTGMAKYTSLVGGTLHPPPVCTPLPTPGTHPHFQPGRTRPVPRLGMLVPVPVTAQCAVSGSKSIKSGLCLILAKSNTGLSLILALTQSGLAQFGRSSLA